MAWTTPIVWVTGQVVTAATMNAQVSGNLNWVAGPDRCQVTNNTTVSVGTTVTLLTWNTNAVISNSAMHSTSVNPSRLIAATAGTYRLDLSLVMSAANLFIVDVRKNAAGSSTGGTSMKSWTLPAGVGIFSPTLDLLTLAANDYLEVFATCTGASANLTATGSGTFVDFRWVGV